MLALLRKQCIVEMLHTHLVSIFEAGAVLDSFLESSLVFS